MKEELLEGILQCYCLCSFVVWLKTKQNMFGLCVNHMTASATPKSEVFFFTNSMEIQNPRKVKDEVEHILVFLCTITSFLKNIYVLI